MGKAKLRVRKYFYYLVTDQKQGFVAGGLKLILLLLSYLYWLGIKIIMLGYSLGMVKPHRLNCKVISIGNITWGGTGKTPLVQMLAGKLKGMEKKAAILTRGYGADEPDLLTRSLPDFPVLVARKRVKSGEKAINEYGVGVILLDDGFQHRRIARDLDILTINSLNPFGSGHLIPRGILREPLGSLKRADLFFLTKSDLTPPEKLAKLRERLGKLNPDAPIIESSHRPVGLYSLLEEDTLELGALKGEEVVTLSGIGDPDSFQQTVKALGANIVFNFTFLDHHQYTTHDLNRVFDSCLEYDVRTIITTEKDMVRLKDLIEGFKLQASSSKLRILALKIKLEITHDEERLDDFLSRIFSG